MSTQTPSPGTTRRPDASMTLLTEVMQRPLDPGYAAAAAEREAAGAPERRRRRVPLTVLLAVVAGALLVSAVLDLRLPGLVDERAVLSAEVERRSDAADALEARLEQLRAEIDGIQAEALRGDGSDVADEAAALGVLAGATPVTGPGVEITLDDASTSQDPVAGDIREEADDDSGRVVDRDVVVVVNGLWAAGAEAVSVNGRRLTSLAAIRAAGDAILVDFRALAPPYTVSAVGDPQQLQTAFASSSAGRYLATIQQNYGVRVSVTGSGALDLPGAGGLRLRYARPPGAEPSAPGDAFVTPGTDDVPAAGTDQEGTP